jgi:hypothetical protein
MLDESVDGTVGFATFETSGEYTIIGVFGRIGEVSKTDDHGVGLTVILRLPAPTGRVVTIPHRDNGFVFVRSLGIHTVAEVSGGEITYEPRASSKLRIQGKIVATIRRELIEGELRDRRNGKIVISFHDAGLIVHKDSDFRELVFSQQHFEAAPAMRGWE